MVDDDSGFGLIDPDRWGKVAVTTLEGEGVDSGNVDVVFVTTETMTELNSEHMGGTGPTDVLAFPMDAPQLTDELLDGVPVNLDGPPVHLGDIVICPEVANSQAVGHVGSTDGEFCLLTIHAALHLLGHDHVTTDERLIMQAREQIYLKKFGFEHPETKSD